ncbi:MAG: hypothetical protein Unbinned805contig1001_34 [Prokaryotic dsDNA virus sp.]|nr:MAG: hypothetical protein Unbinned805contig1001_34 [Prokaryotic dsDNA virus sp.]|tara:strand:+ start:55 stop:231 length:177 start_codon:yes stop_codon:yes gene_type:complete
MANEIYNDSWWGVGGCSNNIDWGSIYYEDACGTQVPDNMIAQNGDNLIGENNNNLILQ